MKNQFTKFCTLFLAVTLLVSCGADKFTGKQYRNRSWVKVEPIAQKKEEKRNAVVTTESVITEQSIQQEGFAAEGSNVAQENAAVSTENVVTSNPLPTPSNKLVVDEAIVEDVVSQKELSSEQSSESLSNKDITHDSDGMLVVEVILAFFLPPLAVYLHDGGSSGLFILTLILCLLSLLGGFWLSGAIFSAWGIATILALLRIFDII